MENKNIGDDYGFSLVNQYLDTFDYYPNIKRFFKDITKDTWLNNAHKLLNKEYDIKRFTLK